jgi:hypothetical protein
LKVATTGLITSYNTAFIPSIIWVTCTWTVVHAGERERKEWRKEGKKKGITRWWTNKWNEKGTLKRKMNVQQHAQQFKSRWWDTVDTANEETWHWIFQMPFWQWMCSWH